LRNRERCTSRLCSLSGARSPDVGQQAAARDNLVRVQHKNRQHRVLHGPAQHKLLAVPADLQRPKKPELHTPSPDHSDANTLRRCAISAE
jgi:hypothetical protein